MSAATETAADYRRQTFGMTHPYATGGPVLEGHTAWCAEHGHSTHTVSGTVQPYCARCGATLTDAEPATDVQHVTGYGPGASTDPKAIVTPRCTCGWIGDAGTRHVTADAARAHVARETGTPLLTLDDGDRFDDDTFATMYLATIGSRRVGYVVVTPSGRIVADMHGADGRIREILHTGGRTFPTIRHAARALARMTGSTFDPRD